MPLMAPVTVMEDEHDHAGRLLAELREITGGYEMPEWGCGTFQALYRGLAELESAMHVHIHLENNVLFPRALALAESVRTGDRLRRSEDPLIPQRGVGIRGFKASVSVSQPPARP
jgi:hemerythrin-like domain-containing protein